MNQSTIILASQSPRRALLLKQIGITPICKPVNIDESIIDGEIALDYCQRLAMQKAQTGFKRSDQSMAVLGSDTIVVFKGGILGKPKNEVDAYNMLMGLSEQQHQVITSVAVVNASLQKSVDSISTVEFGKIDADVAKQYIDSKEPMDKAGSYGIQGFAATWIKHISGSHSGIMGLPLYETNQLLQEFI